MALTLSDVRRIAVDVAQQHSLALDVLGVTRRGVSSASAEVIFGVRDDFAQPSRVVIGVSRQISEGECRGTVRTLLQERLGSTWN
jgi:hypothetical protein